MKRFFCIAIIAAFVLQMHAATYMRGNEGLFEPSSEHFFANLKAVTGLGLNPVKGFQDEGIYASLLTVCEKPTLSLGDSSKPVAVAGDGIGAIWSSADHQCTLLYCDAIPEAANKKSLVDHIAQELSANVSCGDASAVDMTPADYILSSKALRRNDHIPGDSICLYMLPFPGSMRLTLDGWKYLSETRFPHAHCLGLLVIRPSKSPLRFKILLSDKGFRQKDKYIKKILKSIRFEE